MVDLYNYAFETLNWKIQAYLGKSFINTYVSECYQSTPIRNYTRRVTTILGAKYYNIINIKDYVQTV